MIQQLLGFVDVFDLRRNVSSLGWSNSPSGRVRLYQWVYDNLWLKCDKRIIGVANPGVPVSSYGVSLGVRDYIVALRLVTLYLTPVILTKKHSMRNSSQQLQVPFQYSAG